MKNTKNRKSEIPTITSKKGNLHIFIGAAAVCIRTVSFEKLTVREIVTQAGLSRQTFYRCCNGKYDMVSRYISCLLSESYSQAEKRKQMGLFPELFIDSLEKEKKLIAAASSLQGYDNPMQSLNRVLYEGSLEHISRRGDSLTAYQRDLLEVYCESFTHIIERWLNEEIIGNPEDISDRILDVMPEKLKPLLLI